MFQSTHPHGVRLPDPVFLLATYRFNPRTHTGCDTLIRPGNFYITVSFNPRTHTGCDNPAYQLNFPFVVSIHAPTRGATHACFIAASNFSVSIHAPTRGATGWVALIRPAPSKFQSTHPHGVRHDIGKAVF